MYTRSVEDPAGFWSEIASEFYWKQKWGDKVFDENFDVRKGNIKIEVIYLFIYLFNVPFGSRFLFFFVAVFVKGLSGLSMFFFVALLSVVQGWDHQHLL